MEGLKGTMPTKIDVQYNHSDMICWLYSGVGEAPIRFTLSPKLQELFENEMYARINKHTKTKKTLISKNKQKQTNKVLDHVCCECCL